jgi:hypothetical protein
MSDKDEFVGSDEQRNSPEIALIGPEWPTRALLRAQLIEAGFDVVASDDWPIPRQYLRPGMKPRAVVVDLRGLQEPQTALADLRVLFPPERVLVLTALGTVAGEEIRRTGFRVLARPASIADIVGTVSDIVNGPPQGGPHRAG